MSGPGAGGHYRGPAVVSVAGAEVPVIVDLRGRFQPIDGRFHWYGRLAATDALAGKSGNVTLRTEHGSAEGRLSDVDQWGRIRIAGVGRPPFR